MILNISVLKDHGHKISKIAQMSPSMVGQLVKDITAADQSYSNQINALVLAMISLDEAAFDKVISTNTLQLGFESTMIKVVFPFLVRIGMLWQTGSINPAHEHFISNLIRQKLVVAIDGQVNVPEADAKKFILFLPEGEMHEISLLFANYLIKSRKNHCVYLGPSLPLKDLLKVKEHYSPDAIFTIITSALPWENLANVFNEIHQKYPNAEILASGHQVLRLHNKMPEFVRIIQDFDSMVHYLEN